MATTNLSRRRRIATFAVGFLVLATGGLSNAADPVLKDAPIILTVDRTIATGNGPQSFQVNWRDGALLETNFEFQESLNPSLPEEQWNTLVVKAPPRATSVDTFPQATVSPGILPADPQIHYLRVRAVIGVNGQNVITGPWSLPDPAIAGPLPPKDFTATNNGVGSVKLQWANQAGADPLWTSTDVYRQLPGGGFLRIASLAPGVTSMIDPIVPPNIGITYILFAVRQMPIGPYIEQSTSASPKAVVVTLPLPKPAAPTNLMASLTHVGPTQDRVDLTWIDNATDEDGFAIEFANDPTFLVGTQQVLIPTANATQYTQFVAPDTRRWYRVRAFRNADGQFSDPSNVASIGAIPAAPTNLAATKVTNAEVHLTWKDNSTTEDGFRVEGCSGLCNTNSTWFFLGNAGPNDNQFSDNTVTQLITRSYRVFAYNGSGLSGASNIITVNTPIAPISKPINLNAIGLDSRHIKINWTDTSSNEDGFRIEYSAGPGEPWAVLNTVGAGIQTYTDGFSLNPNTQRCYRVRAFQTSNTFSDPSNTACAVTAPPQIPGVPSNLQGVALDSRRIKLTWIDNATNEQGFKVERSTDGQTWTLIATLYVVDLTQYINTGLLASHSYTYRVRAFNGDGDSDPSNIVTVTTPGPPVPIWIHPGHDNEVAVSACSVDGRVVAGHSIGAVLVYITDTKDGTTQFAGEAAVLADNTWTLPLTLSVAGTYHLAAFSRVGTGATAQYSGAARIFSWIVPADSLIC